MESADAPSKNLRRLYIDKLLQNALNNRDASAGRWVSEELERDAELESALFGSTFDELLEEQPDAVYVFIRNRIIHLGVDETMDSAVAPSAAEKSLEVAIQDGDVGTLAGWLELIAHEPLAYQTSGDSARWHPCRRRASLPRWRIGHTADTDRRPARARYR